jgi:hypothetical protein
LLAVKVASDEDFHNRRRLGNQRWKSNKIFKKSVFRHLRRRRRHTHLPLSKSTLAAVRARTRRSSRHPCMHPSLPSRLSSHRFATTSDSMTMYTTSSNARSMRRRGRDGHYYRKDFFI